MMTRSTTLWHISDTIAEGDTTVERLRLQYDLICWQLGVVAYEVACVGSAFGDSAQTGRQVRALLHQLHQLHDVERKESGAQDDERIVICANNASRAKHKDSGNAKGSGCLRATVQLHPGGRTYEVVGVDDDVFAQFGDYIQTLRCVSGVRLSPSSDYYVADISQGSQFRSLEYRPIVQLLIYRYDEQYIQTNKLLDRSPYTLPVCAAQSIVEGADEEDIVPLGRRGGEEGGIDAISSHDYRRVQLIGQYHKFLADRGVDEDDLSRTLLAQYTAQVDVSQYRRRRASLGADELVVLDRDRFGNVKCACAYDDGIYGIAAALGCDVGDHIQVARQRSDETWYTERVIITHSISDHTGHNCLRNGSSRGPDGERYVELNKSIDTSYTPRSELADVPIGAKIVVSI